MASTPAPSKSQPLHNFELPELKWNKDGQPYVPKKRRRFIKSPSQQPNTSSAPPLPPPPLQEYVSARPPRVQSPLADSVAMPSRESPVHGDLLMKQSPVSGESSKPSSNCEELKNSAGGGDSEKLSLIREEARRHLQKRNSSLESEALKKGKGDLIECRRNQSRNSALTCCKSRVNSSSSEQIEEERSNPTEDDDSEHNKSKILIKIPSKNNKKEEEKSKEGLPKTSITDNQVEAAEVQEEGKINNNFDGETKIRDLRPRKPKSKSHKTNVIVEMKNANKSGINEGKNSGEKQKKSGKEKIEKQEKVEEKGDKKEKKKLSISISLAKEEIEEDIFMLTGSKPARRPKRRAKNVQKQVDYAFPGLWLVSITPESYKVS